MDTLLKNGCSEDTDIPLYDAEILSRIDPNKFKAEYKNGVTPLKPGENLHIRPLSSGDFDRGFLDLLRQLTIVGDLSKEDFLDRFRQMKGCTGTYYVTVIEDLSTGQIIGSATLVKEQKFIHHATWRGRIEDVIVSDAYRGKQLGKILVDLLVTLSQELGCYKVSLECKDHNVPFYVQFGFEKSPEQNFMQQRFFD